MKIGKIERVERKTILLEKDIDFSINDLVNGMNGTKILPKEWKEKWEINNLSMGKITWLSQFDKKTMTIRAQIEKDLFIEI